MGRLLHRGDDRLCRQPDAAARLCRGRPCRLADRPDRAGRRADHARPSSRWSSRCWRRALNAPAVAQGLGARARSSDRCWRTAASARRKPRCCAGSSSPPAATARCVVSADEAELLWRLKDACLDADNAPGWKTLFVQAVGNHLMAYSSYTPLERDEAARLDAFVADHQRSVLGFFARMGADPSGRGARRARRKTPRGRSRGRRRRRQCGHPGRGAVAPGACRRRRRPRSL